MNIQENKFDINIWFALVKIKALNGNNSLEGAFGAFVNVAYKATSTSDLIERINLSFKENNFEVCEIDDIEPKESLTIVNPDNAEKLELLRDIEEEGYDFSWGVYYTFDQ